MPIHASVRGTAFDIRKVPLRLQRLTRDPWTDYWTSRQRIDAFAKQILSRPLTLGKPA
jgi:hypothetical protein